MSLTRCIVFSYMLLAPACAKIPEDDELFLSRSIPLGMDHTTASQLVSNRGFIEKELWYRSSYSFNHKTKSFDEDAYDYLRYVRQNVGFVKVLGKPDGVLFCFEKSYTYLVASGIRILCWTVDEQDKITWRQAGWNGAGL